MSKSIELTPEALASCEAKGFQMSPHPICVLKEEAIEGLSKEEARKKCLEAQKYHGISKLKCLAISKGIES